MMGGKALDSMVIKIIAPLTADDINGGVVVATDEVIGSEDFEVTLRLENTASVPATVKYHLQFNEEAVATFEDEIPSNEMVQKDATVTAPVLDDDTEKTINLMLDSVAIV